MAGVEAAAWIVLGRTDGGAIGVPLDSTGEELGRHRIPDAELSSWVAAQESSLAPRWVWNDAPQWYPRLLSDGVRVARCHDLRLCHAILRDSVLVDGSAAVRGAHEWDAAP